MHAGQHPFPVLSCSLCITVCLHVSLSVASPLPPHLLLLERCVCVCVCFGVCVRARACKNVLYSRSCIMHLVYLLMGAAREVQKDAMRFCIRLHTRTMHAHGVQDTPDTLVHASISMGFPCALTCKTHILFSLQAQTRMLVHMCLHIWLDLYVWVYF